jgi:hypothetical protein
MHPTEGRVDASFCNVEVECAVIAEDVNSKKRMFFGNLLSVWESGLENGIGMGGRQPWKAVWSICEKNWKPR